jgi:3-oxoacyl-[acyl-carrier protein] reductase
MSCLANRVAIVTGGSSGIGLAIAGALAAEGVRVGVTARGADRLKAAALALAARAPAGDKAVLARAGDVARASDVTAMVDAVMDRWDRIDVLVNNAGISVYGPIETLTEADWNATLDVNLKGAFLYTRAVLPIMKRRNRGDIVNIASLAGVTGFAGLAAYSASKFGLIGFTQALAEELDPFPIRTTAICPGYVNTPMVAHVGVPPAEMIQPEDIARTVLHLLHLGERVVIKQVVMERKGAS